MKFITIVLSLICFSFLHAQNRNVHSQKYETIYFEIDSSVKNIGLRSKIKTAINFVNKKGKVFSTVGYGKGKIVWNEFDIEVAGGKLEKGFLVVTGNPSFIKKHELKIVFKFSKTGEIFLEETVKLNYNGNYLADFSGKDGKENYQRRNGREGSIGTSSSSGNGGAGGNGGNGNDGKKGFQGKDASDLTVNISTVILEESNDTLISFYISKVDEADIDTFIINTKSGTLSIACNGGKGGDGGQGGHGGSGGNGGSGPQGSRDMVNGVLKVTPAGSGGNGGDGGNGGSGGDGGNGGSGGNIKVEGTSAEIAMLKYVSFNTAAGSAGKAGEHGLAGKRGIGGSGGRGVGQKGVPGYAGTAGQDGFEGKSSGVVTVKEI